MPTIDANTLFQIGVWLLSGVFFVMKMDKKLGLISYQIEELKERQTRYNNLQERMAGVESSARSAHHRLDNLEGRR